MKLFLLYTLTFLGGLAGSVLFLSQDRSSAAAPPDVFNEWPVGETAVSDADFKTRDRLLPLMAAADGPRAWQCLMQAGARPRVQDMEAIAHTWARRDGRAAVAFGSTLPDPMERGAFLNVAWSCWFGSAPDDFLTWLKQHPTRDAIVSRMNYMEYRRLLKTEMASLDAIAALYAHSPHYRGPLEPVALRLWQQGGKQREAVLAWLRRQPESAERDAAWRGIAADLAVTDPPAAALLVKEITAERLRRQVASTVAARMAKADPQAALTFAQGLPDATYQELAWQSVLGTWSLNDSASALAHLRQNVATITLDRLKPVAGACARHAPAGFLQLLAKMQGSEETRKTMIDAIIRDWHNQSREDLQRWLASADSAWLSAETLKRYQKMATIPSPYSSGGSRKIQGRSVWISH